MVRRTYHVAVLECDTLIPPVVKKYGGYGELYESFLRKGMRQLPTDVAQPDLRVSKWDVQKSQKYPDPEKVDAILVSGSKCNAYGDDKWVLSLVDYMRGVLKEHSTKVIGICFGHQLVARAAGAVVGPNPAGWEISRSTFDCTKEGQKLFGKKTMALHQMHRDMVITIPEGYVNLGSSPICAVQGLYRPGKALTLQAHPEFNGGLVTLTLAARTDQGVFNSEQAKDALSRINLEYDERSSSQAICKFLLDY